MNKKCLLVDANITLMIREAKIAEDQLHSSHYLKTVTELGDGQKILANRDIFSSSGVKLMGAGALVNSSIYERLLNHKLRPKLDESLTADDSVNSQSIVDEAIFLLGLDPCLLRMRAAMEDDSQLSYILGKIPLNPCLVFKLTVMRSKHKELFQRSIYVSLVTIYIGIQAGLNEKQLVQLATAALLHDIGLLHVDPKILELSYQMSKEERRHLYAHPITAWMILNENPEYPNEVAEAVLQHHERLDGSGYPQALHGENIGQFGQMIAVAEIVASHFGKNDAHLHLMRLETILKLNSRQYGRKLIGYLRIFYVHEAEHAPMTDEDKGLIALNLELIAEIISKWETRRERFPVGGMSEFINERMQSLRMEAFDAGLNPYALAHDLLDIENNPDASAEMRILLQEIIWQVNAILHELRRRWPKIDQADQSPQTSEIQGWISDVEMLLTAQDR